MTVRIQIHRGTQQIGGSITEIATPQHRIFIDFGAALPGSASEITDKQMLSLLTGTACDGIFFSHYHGDHAGLIDQIPENIPLYIGNTAREVLYNIKKALHDEAGATRLQSGRLKAISSACPVQIGDIKVTPYFVDHSAAESYMFLIEAGGRRILHTGDFRTHGRIGPGLFRLLPIICPSSHPVDVLITEGTMMGRSISSQSPLSEAMLQQQATALLAKNRHAFLICSSTNLDTLASFHAAAKRNKIPMIANDYICSQCRLFSKRFGQQHAIYNFDRLYPWRAFSKATLSDGLSQADHMRKYGFLLMVSSKPAYRACMEQFRDLNPLLIYSLWDGFLNENHAAFQPELAACIRSWPNCRHLHTGGHVDAASLARVIRIVRPQQAILPIHTEMAARFRTLPIGKFQDALCLLRDGEEYVLDEG